MGTDTNQKFRFDGISGKKGLITDVPGVSVGHFTLKEGNARTGVTAILPHPGNLFYDKVMASCHVINGYGKAIGLSQVKELGSIETPIILTNTLSAPTAADALVKYMLKTNPAIHSVNPLVLECNDAALNDIRSQYVKTEHVFSAIEGAGSDFDEGAVGAGTGMCCFGLKGGIGSSSRIFSVDGREYTLGALVLANFGDASRLRIDGAREGERIQSIIKAASEGDKGSVIIILATDAPFTERQLERICKRSVLGLARVGSYIGNGSGDFAVMFTTANRIPAGYKGLLEYKAVPDACIDTVFINTASAVEEAVVSALYHAETTVGYRGNTVLSLKEFL